MEKEVTISHKEKLEHDWLNNSKVLSEITCKKRLHLASSHEPILK